MKNIFKTLLLLLLPLFVLTGCQASETTPTYEIRTDKTVEVVYADNFKRQYEDGELLSVEGLTLYFDGALLTDTSTYFFTRNNTTPVESKIDLETNKLTSSSKEYVTVTIYAAYEYDTSIYYLSDAINLEVRNQNAATPWVTMVVGGVVFVAIAVLLTIKIYHDKKVGSNPK